MAEDERFMLDFQMLLGGTEDEKFAVDFQKKKVDGEEICTAEWGVVGRNTYGCQLYMVDESHSFSGWHSQDVWVQYYFS